mgnify:CR=1 FL=1
MQSTKQTARENKAITVSKTGVTNKASLIEIKVTPYGKIDSLVFLTDKLCILRYTSLSKLKQDIDSKIITPTNIKINEQGNIITTGRDFSTLSIDTIDIPIRSTSIKITKIIYENERVFGLFSGVKVIISLTLETTDMDTYNKLLTMGFKSVNQVIKKDTHGNKVITYEIKIDSIWLRHLLAKSNRFEEIFERRGIIRLNNNLVVIGSKKAEAELIFEGAKLIEDNTIYNKLDTWSEKMKLLGLYEDYDINYETLSLDYYRGNSNNLMLPPVRTINLENAHNHLRNIKKLKIPDTVYRIESLPSQYFTDIQLGENTLGLFEDMLNPNAETFDTLNSFSALKIQHLKKLVYRLQFGGNAKLDGKSNIELVEIIENK